MATVVQAIKDNDARFAQVDVVTIREGDIIRYPNRTNAARLSMKVEQAVDCGDGVMVPIGQGRTLAGARLKALWEKAC